MQGFFYRPTVTPVDGVDRVDRRHRNPGVFFDIFLKIFLKIVDVDRHFIEVLSTLTAIWSKSYRRRKILVEALWTSIAVWPNPC